MEKINEHDETLLQDLCDIARKRNWDERLSKAHPKKSDTIMKG